MFLFTPLGCQELGQFSWVSFLVLCSLFFLEGIGWIYIFFSFLGSIFFSFCCFLLFWGGILRELSIFGPEFLFIYFLGVDVRHCSVCVWCLLSFFEGGFRYFSTFGLVIL